MLVNTQAGNNEHPITVAFIEQYSKSIHPVVVVIPELRDLWKTEGHAETRGLDSHEELTFLRLAELKQRFPSRMAQFCTEFLKLRPMVRWIAENIKEDYERYSGVRRDESVKRAKRQPREWDETFDCRLSNPIVDWTKQMCFDYVRAHGEEINALYTMGFGRVGCAPCINSSKGDIQNWATRFPEMIEKVRIWEKEVGRTFFAPMVPGMKINWVDEVVAWSRTSHGGRQAELPVMQEREACESRFGLCE